MTTIAELAAELGTNTLDLLDFAGPEFDDTPQDAELTAEQERVIRDAWAVGSTVLSELRDSQS